MSIDPTEKEQIIEQLWKIVFRAIGNIDDGDSNWFTVGTHTYIRDIHWLVSGDLEVARIVNAINALKGHSNFAYHSLEEAEENTRYVEPEEQGDYDEDSFYTFEYNDDGEDYPLAINSDGENLYLPDFPDEFPDVFSAPEGKIFKEPELQLAPLPQIDPPPNFLQEITNVRVPSIDEAHNVNNPEDSGIVKPQIALESCEGCSNLVERDQLHAGYLPNDSGYGMALLCPKCKLIFVP